MQYAWNAIKFDFFLKQIKYIKRKNLTAYSRSRKQYKVKVSLKSDLCLYFSKSNITDTIIS